MQLKLYPKGLGTAKGKSLSVFLQLADWETIPSEQKVYAEYKFVIRDQLPKDGSFSQALTMVIETSCP
ncbi:hypothetical protein LOK49_LG02G03320 [Camellia lanceoleosa]|uniref:Uncharacterized protein n=1 Tax=Camellia lanceoleosa TaxID=1840588 RepID=A0ACC0IV38_9ERIC|nr:hypothetical protein LOK49_LG02G03320 [Camellia lanceoleosa]